MCYVDYVVEKKKNQSNGFGVNNDIFEYLKNYI